MWAQESHGDYFLSLSLNHAGGGQTIISSTLGDESLESRGSRAVEHSLEYCTSTLAMLVPFWDLAVYSYLRMDSYE